MAGDAAVVDEAGQNFECEYYFGAYRGDEACKADDPACVVEMLSYERVQCVARRCEEACEGVVGDGAVEGEV